jgi:hypothetical protein
MCFTYQNNNGYFKSFQNKIKEIIKGFFSIATTQREVDETL